MTIKQLVVTRGQFVSDVSEYFVYFQSHFITVTSMAQPISPMKDVKLFVNKSHSFRYSLKNSLEEL